MLNPFLQAARPYPRKLSVDLHSFCNARCTMCPYPRYAPRQTQGHMDRHRYRQILDEMALIGRTRRFQPILTFCYMGEPFLADDLGQCVRDARDRDLAVYLNTNAALMTPPRVDELLAAAFDGAIHISVHGITPEVYYRVTGLDLDPTLANIRYLLSRYDPARVCIRGVDDGWPVGERDKWRAFWQPLGVQLECLAPISRCGGVGRLLPARCRDRRTVRLFGCRCHHPLVEMVILFDGRAVMCCQDMGRELVWGDVGKDGILAVWNGSVRRQALQQLYGGRPASRQFLCTRCEQALGLTGLVRSLCQTALRKALPTRPKAPTNLPTAQAVGLHPRACQLNHPAKKPILNFVEAGREGVTPCGECKCGPS